MVTLCSWDFMGKTISQWNFLPLSTWTPTLTFHSLSCTIPALCTLQRIHLGQILPPVILGCWGGWIRKTSSIWLLSKRFWEYRNISKIKIIAVLNCGAESNTWVLVHPDFLGVLLQELPEHSWFHPKIHSWFHPKIHSWFSQRAANPGNSPKEGN